MKHGWLTKTVGGRTIEHIPCPNPGGVVDETAPATGVIHTVEGSLDSGLGVFRQHFAPHFVLDGERIIQLVPLGTMAAALENRPGGVETNSITRAQIEVAGHSSEDPWECDESTGEALADLMATLADAAEIPLERPFEDKMPAKPWATTNFVRRSAGKWGHVAGWYGHVEVPENEHWDPGAFEWSKTIVRAKTFAGGAGRHSTLTRSPRRRRSRCRTTDRFRSLRAGADGGGLVAAGGRHGRSPGLGRGHLLLGAGLPVPCAHPPTRADGGGPGCCREHGAGSGLRIPLHLRPAQPAGLAAVLPDPEFHHWLGLPGVRPLHPLPYRQ